MSAGVAWVVGVGARDGTGAAIARRFAAGGLQVAVTGRTAEKIQAVVDEINALGGRAVAALGDASSDQGLANALQIVKQLGPLRAAIYNAGGSQWRSGILEMDTAFIEDVWRTNCLGGFIVGREAAKLMLPQERGSILFTGSISGSVARPKLAAYAAAKFGLRAVAQAMAREFWAKNIHVAHIVPVGPIDGDRLLSRFPDVRERRPPDALIPTEQIAEAFWNVHCQPRSAWTFEMDLRPYCETLAME
ncbi:SDR family NAD(P)-dependent oxidoreductase [Noviherbaspirillum sedimenti]|uniref:SDR family NAD(P)-dependent oxidoreductase n=2 Tax=Noviherbaspirillum sedimenti TaxID=2320865 RepID=A0A3A3G8L7_9BURK|nr:SDR family NAD(P)-dependent oxidoreductase [Noviherbaspirillum sedimenti]